MADKVSDQERIALEDELQSIISEFIKVNHTRLQFALAAWDGNRKIEIQKPGSMSSQLFRYVEYLAADFYTANKHFAELQLSLKSLLRYNVIEKSSLSYINRVKTAITACTDKYKSDNIIWHEKLKVATEQSTQTDSITHLEQSTQCEKINCATKSTNCNLQTDIIAKDNGMVRMTNCATNCDLTQQNPIEKTSNTQPTDAKMDDKHRKDGKKPKNLQNKMKKACSTNQKINKLCVDYKVETKNRFAVLPMEESAREKFHPKNQRNLERTSFRHSTQKNGPKFYGKNRFRQQQFHSEPMNNDNSSKRSYLSAYSNEMKPESGNIPYSSSLQRRKWHERQQQQQHEYTFYNGQKTQNCKKFDYSRNDYNASNKFTQQSNISALVKLFAYWLETNLPKAYSAESTNRHFLSKKLKVLI